jgi:hypothetical protein
MPVATLRLPRCVAGWPRVAASFGRPAALTVGIAGQVGAGRGCAAGHAGGNLRWVSTSLPASRNRAHAPTATGIGDDTRHDFEHDPARLSESWHRMRMNWLLTGAMELPHQEPLARKGAGDVTGLGAGHGPLGATPIGGAPAGGLDPAAGGPTAAAPDRLQATGGREQGAGRPGPPPPTTASLEELDAAVDAIRATQHRCAHALSA